MDPNHVVFDISSDEEVGLDESKDDDLAWMINELLEEVNRVNDDSDDVVVVGEFKPKQKSRSSKSIGKDDDEDCVVLDGDPDNPVSTVNGSENGSEDSENGSDDLLVVGEKGQIACRDYPHSRNQCARFPFHSTPHDSHCDLCHCYVCDSLAPCVHWGTGINIGDHCHATEKNEFWVNQRKSFKERKSHLATIQNIPHPLPLPQPSHISPALPLNPNSTAQNQVSRPSSIRPCSSTSNIGVQNMANLTRTQRPGVALSRSRFQPNMVSQQLLGVQSNILRKDRGHSFANLSSQFSSSHTMFKRPGSGRGSLNVNRSGYGLSNNANPAYASHFSRNTLPTVIPSGRASSNWQDLHGYDSCQPNMGSVFANTVPSQQQIYCQSVLESNDCQGTYQPGDTAQNVVNSSFADPSRNWAGNPSQSNLPSGENSQLQSAEPAYTPSMMEFNPQFPVSTDPNPLDLFENWILENQSVHGVPEGSVHSPNGLNLPSMEPAPPSPLPPPPPLPPVDAGMLYFDFETSWSSLTRLVD